jgi:hypothetical protein
VAPETLVADPKALVTDPEAIATDPAIGAAPETLVADPKALVTDPEAIATDPAIGVAPASATIPSQSQYSAKERKLCSKRLDSDAKVAQQAKADANRKESEKRIHAAMEKSRLASEKSRLASEAAREAQKQAAAELAQYRESIAGLLSIFATAPDSLTLHELMKLATADASTEETKAKCMDIIIQRDDKSCVMLAAVNAELAAVNAKLSTVVKERDEAANQFKKLTDTVFATTTQEDPSKKKKKKTAPSSETAPSLTESSPSVPSPTAPALAEKSVAASTDAPSVTAPAPNEGKKVLEPRFFTRMKGAVQANSNARQELEKQATQLEERIARAGDASSKYKLTDISPEARRLRKELQDMQDAFLKITLQIDAYEKGTATMEHLVHCVQTSPDLSVIRTALINFTDLEKLVGTTTTLPASILAAAIVKDPTPFEAANMKAPRPEQQVGASSATCIPKDPWSEMVAHATLPEGVKTDNTQRVKVVFSIPSTKAPSSDVVGCKAEGTFTREAGVPVTSIMRGFLTKMATDHPLLHNKLVDCEIIKEGCATGEGSPPNINWKLPACYVDRSGKLVIVACARK